MTSASSSTVRTGRSSHSDHLDGPRSAARQLEVTGPEVQTVQQDAAIRVVDQRGERVDRAQPLQRELLLPFHGSARWNTCVRFASRSEN